MADKEATVYIVDVGQSMNDTHQGRSKTDLDWAMTYVWDKITATVATDRKTATLGVIGLRTDGTENELSSEQGYRNISILQDIGQLLLPGLKHLRDVIKPSSTNNGDAITAVVIAISMISKFCKRLKYKRQIVLVTNGRGSMDADDVPEIASQLKAEEIELVIVGVDFDDPEYGFKEEDKDKLKAGNEEVLRALANDANGVYGTMQQAVDELGTPRIKSTRPVPSYRGLLTLGNPDESDSAICINVQRYPRVMIRRPATASQFVQRTSLGDASRSVESSATLVPDSGHSGGVDQTKADGLTDVKYSRVYHVSGESVEGGKREIERDNLAKGYEYGRTAVHISESDYNVVRLETKQGLEILGFVPWSNYERYMGMSVSCVTIAERTNEKAILAFSSFIHALFELENYAIARLVPKPDKEPMILLLAPSIDEDYECLLDVQLPFAEDVRQYKFPPLDKVITVSGKEIRVHRNLPSEELQTAMSDYVDSMDLATFGQDDEGNPAEYAQMTDTFSPVLHRLDQAVRWRATHPDEPVPPPYEILTRYSKPPDSLMARSERRLETLKKAADVKKVPPKTQSRKRARNEVKPLSGLDVSALLNKNSKKRKPPITPQNAIPEFRQALDATESVADIKDAAKRFGEIIEQHIRDSFGGIHDGRVIVELSLFREEMIQLEEPKVWNEFANTLKNELLDGKFGGDRTDLWREISKNNLGLIEKKVSGISDVGDEEAKRASRAPIVLRREIDLR